MKLALHICCSICFREPYRSLKAKGFDITGIYYNPNIQPFQEYLNRLDALKATLKNDSLTFLVPEYHASEAFFDNKVKTREDQCSKCYEVRLTRTVKEAKAKYIKRFSTTLLGSPYQDHKKILAIAGKLGVEHDMEFVYDEKWKDSYRESHNTLRALGVYTQKYCGCIYSKMDRKLEKKHK